MPLDSQLDAQDSKSSHASRPTIGEIKATTSPRKKRRRRKKRVDPGIPTWRIVLTAALSIIVIGATAYQIHATIEEQRLAAIEEVHAREVRLQTSIAKFRAKALTNQNDLRLDDLRDSVNSIMNTDYRFAFNKRHRPRAEELIGEAMQLLSDSASASSRVSLKDLSPSRIARRGHG